MTTDDVGHLHDLLKLWGVVGFVLAMQISKEKGAGEYFGEQKEQPVTYLPHVHVAGHLGPFFLLPNKWTKPLAFWDGLSGPDAWK